jgi:hypothetical protein
MNGTVKFSDFSSSGFLAELSFPNAESAGSIRAEQASYEATVAGRR